MFFSVFLFCFFFFSVKGICCFYTFHFSFFLIAANWFSELLLSSAKQKYSWTFSSQTLRERHAETHICTSVVYRDVAMYIFFHYFVFFSFLILLGFPLLLEKHTTLTDSTTEKKQNTTAAASAMITSAAKTTTTTKTATKNQKI